MDLNPELAQREGVVPSRVLIEGGMSYRRIRQLCSSGRLVRVRKGWLALHSAAPDLVAAARNGGVLTCVTQARRLGLWTSVPDQAVHLGLGQNAKRPTASGLCLHWNSPIIPRDRFQLEDSIANVLATVALCLSSEDAHAVWESALNRRLIELPELQRLPFTGRARELAKNVDPYSDSGLESIMKLRLRRLGITVRAQVWILGHCVDLLIGERLVIQIDGGTHVGKQRSADIAHDALLTLNGYQVIRVSYEQIMYRWHEVHDLVLRAVAQRLHLVSAPN